MPDFDPSLCFLFDNGSLRPASTLSLRRIARRLQDEMAIAVKPVSLLHSTKVNTQQLEGRPAELLESALRDFARAGGRQALLLPLFFGPSAALVDYVPERVAAIQAEHPLLEIRLASSLIEDGDDSAEVLAKELAASVDRLLHAAAVERPQVVVVDHGSPRPDVTAVRNLVATALAQALGERVAGVTAASMERRDGPEYAFNEPLLDSALQDVIGRSGAREVIVALQFLQDGRHAGPAGDIAEICATVLAEHPAVRVRFTETLGESDAVRALLKRRWREALAGT